METKQYYCHKVYCQTNNQKLKALSEWLKQFEYKMFFFEEESHKKKFLGIITNFLTEINSKYRGRDVSVRLIEFNGSIQYEFENGSCEAVGCITLWPIKGTITFDEDE